LPEGCLRRRNFHAPLDHDPEPKVSAAKSGNRFSEKTIVKQKGDGHVIFIRWLACRGSFVAHCLAFSILFDLPGKGRKTAPSDSDVGYALRRGLRTGNA
jgi:hypothetical protein